MGHLYKNSWPISHTIRQTSFDDASKWMPFTIYKLYCLILPLLKSGLKSDSKLSSSIAKLNSICVAS